MKKDYSISRRAKQINDHQNQFVTGMAALSSKCTIPSSPTRLFKLRRGLVRGDLHWSVVHRPRLFKLNGFLRATESSACLLRACGGVRRQIFISSFVDCEWHRL
jgi:hypothetical protein